MVGTCLLACEGLWVGEVRGRRGNGRVGLGAHLYFDEHWADATMDGEGGVGGSRLVASYSVPECQLCPWGPHAAIRPTNPLTSIFNT
jgi:hypothetical protein